MILSYLVRHWHRQVIIVISLCLLGLAAMTLNATSSFAQDASGGGQSTKNCQGEGILSRIVPCITKAMEQSTMRLTNALEGYLLPAYGAALTLAIVLYGVKAMSPEGNVPRVSVPFLIKIGVITLMMSNFGGFIPAVYGTMNDSVDIVSNALEISNKCPSTGASSGGGGAASGAGSKVWKEFDCVLGKLFGFDGKDGNLKLIASVFGLLTGFLFSGSFGMIAFLSILGVLWSVFMLIYKSTLAFISGYLLACFMVIISPLFLPCYLFQVTQPYFTKWLETFYRSFFLPILIIGYAVFALSIYNKFLFEGKHAETFKKITDKAFAESITGQKTECLGTLLNNAFFRKLSGVGSSGKDSGDNDKPYKSASVANVVNPPQSGGQGLCIKVPTIDFKKVEGNFKNNQQFFRQVFVDGMALFLLAWLLSAALASVEHIAGYIAGSVAGQLLGPVSSTEQRIKAGFDNAKAKALEAFKKSNGENTSGTDFIRALPGAVIEGAKGLGRGVSN